jgi:hypothetical protein
MPEVHWPGSEHAEGPTITLFANARSLRRLVSPGVVSVTVADGGGESEPELVADPLALLAAGGDAPGSPLHAQPGWPGASEDAGRQMAALAGRGNLAQGQRAVLA